MQGVSEHTTSDALRRTHVISMDNMNTKNVLGDLGARCDYCSGLGFTNAITGGSHSCTRCEGTGIKTDKVAMQKKIESLEQDVINLKKELGK